jgi:PAS domain S-box-containing protein
MAPSDFQRIFESSPVPQLLLDRRGVIADVTDGYTRLAGQSRAMTVGRSVVEVPPYAGLGEAATRRLNEDLEKVWRSGLQFPHQLMGGYISAALSVPVLDANGAVSQIVHTIGQPARSSEPLESPGERRLRKIIEHSYDSLVLVDQSGKPFFASPSTERVRGYRVEDLLRVSLLELIHPEDLPRFGQGVKKLLSQPDGVMVIQYRARHRDGHWQILETVAANHLNDPDVLAIIATTRDVTERVALEEMLRQRNEELQIALEAAHAISWDVDLVGKGVRYSSDAEEFFGLPSVDGDQHGLEQTVHPGDRDAVGRLTRQAIETGEDLNLEFRGRPEGPEGRHYAARGRVLRDAAGRSVRIVGVTWDVTERMRVRAEREEIKRRLQEGQKLESLGILAGGIAHDFNNILTTILGNASLTRLELPETSRALDHIDQIEEASRRATDLCRQMLAYAGKGRFVLERIDLNELIEDTTHLLQVSISKRAALRFNLDRQLPPIVADCTQIRQVLMNLVINASDAIDDHDGSICISTGVVRADRQYLEDAFQGPDIPAGDYVFMEISDTGVGMSPEVRGRIFEPFFTSKFTGRGLGLAAVAGIVQGHKGALRVYSEPGKGSTFKLLLPKATGDTESEAVPPVEHAPLVGRGTVLVIDDEEKVQAVAASMLRTMGFGVLLASDGRQGLEVYRQHRGEITTVLMDLTMPNLDGEETYRELRRLAPEVRVLLMSGYNEQDAVARFIGKGLAGFIQKPFSLEDLRSSLRKALG